MNEPYMYILADIRFPWMMHTLYIALNSSALVVVEDFRTQLSMTRYASTIDVPVVTHLFAPRMLKWYDVSTIFALGWVLEC